MKRPLLRFKSIRLAYVALLVCVILLFSGLTVFAAEEGSPDKPVIEPTAITSQIPGVASGEVQASPKPITTYTPKQEEVKPKPQKPELYPTDVQTITENDSRQIIKTYVLTTNDNPEDIPSEDFTHDGWKYSLTDITQKKTSGTDTREHTETVELNTDTNDLNAILTQLAPTIEFKSEDGYSGLIALDLASVKCEPAGYKKSSYTVSATREYPHLSSNDVSLIPKTITDNGRTLELDGVSWEAQGSVNVDYQEVADSYKAVAKYTAKASKSTVTGYITTAEYKGEIAKTLTGDTVYTAYFFGTEINPQPKPIVEPEPIETPEPSATETPIKEQNSTPTLPLLIGVAVIAALLAGGGVFLFLRHNVKVYTISDKGRVLVAKVRISAKNPVIDLTPLNGKIEGEHFGLEIDRFSAKGLNGKTIDVVFGTARLQHKIAYEGNTYRIDADFKSGIIKGVY